MVETLHRCNGSRRQTTLARQFDVVHKLQGGEASLKEIRRYIVGARVFHFAGHALASPERNGLPAQREDSRTMLPQLLNAESISSMDLRQLQLAVLSACATAADLEPGASGTESLTAAASASWRTSGDGQPLGC